MIKEVTSSIKKESKNFENCNFRELFFMLSDVFPSDGKIIIRYIKFIKYKGLLYNYFFELVL